MKSPIQRYEYGRLLIGQEGFTKPYWDAFVKFNTLHENKYFDVLHNGLKFKQYVGVIQVNGLLVQINPKADKNDEDKNWQGVLLQMLKTCNHLKAQSAGPAIVRKQNLNLLEVYFEYFLREVEGLIRQGLVKKYRKKSANVKALKGKLEFAQHIQNNLIHKERFFTSHQVYDNDHLIHQILALALEIIGNFSSGSYINDLCKRVELNFPDVSRVHINKKILDSIQLNRKTAPYERAMELARLIILNYSPDIAQGNVKMLALLFDMNKLWEEYVLVMLRRYALLKHPHLTIRGQSSKSFWGSNSLKPDIVISNKGETIISKNETIIIDTKWKLPGSHSASVSDLRQMYAYGRFWKAKKVVLLYPGNKKQNDFKPFLNKYDLIDYSCKLGFVSVLKQDSNELDPDIGENILNEIGI